MKKLEILFLVLIANIAFLSSPFLYGEETDVKLPLNGTMIKSGQALRFNHLTTEDGIQTLNTRGILQDSQGFMWFATANGLNRFDGYDFKVYLPEPDNPHSISHNNIYSLYEDRQGFIWVGTWNGGLNKYDRTTDKFTVYQNDPADPFSLSHNSVNIIYEDRNGIMWLGTKEGLNQFNPDTGQFVRYLHSADNFRSLSHNQVWAIIEDDDGQLWIGTEGGLDRFNRETNEFDHYQFDPLNPHSISSNHIQAIISDHNNGLWVGTNGGGLNHFNHESGRFTIYQSNPEDPQSLSHNDIKSLYLESSGALWVGTNSSGINYFDPKHQSFTHYETSDVNPTSFKGNRVNNIYRDKTGTLWFSTFTGGINILDRGVDKFELYQHDPNNIHSLSNNFVWDIVESPDAILWMGTVGGGLISFSPATGQFKNYRHDPKNINSLRNDGVYGIYANGDGYIWISSFEGLDMYNPTKNQFTHYRHNPNDLNSLGSNEIQDVLEDKDGFIWIAFKRGGLDKFNPATGRFKHYVHNPDRPASIPIERIMKIFEDSAGILWFATFGGGLAKFDSTTEKFNIYRHDPDDPGSLSHNELGAIFEDENGIFWIGGAGGLNRFDPVTEIFTPYRSKDGLPSDLVLSIVEDNQGFLWLGIYGGGLSKFDPQKETFENYDESDGLQPGLAFLQGAIKTSSGKLYFGGNNGLNAFYPNQLKKNPLIPPIVLTEFSLFNVPVSIGTDDSLLTQTINETDNIILTHEQSVFSFQFAALNYRFPEKNQYSYIMEGFEKKWTLADSTRRFATYTNLDPGNYIFRVKGSNNDGLWNDEGKSIRITIIPPWWQTLWFQVLVIVLVSGLLFGSYRLRVSSMRIRSANLENQIVERTRDLSESEERFRGLSMATTEAVVIHNGLTVLDVNDAACQIYGYSQNEFIGKKIVELLAPDMVKVVADRVRANSEEVAELEVVRKGGEIFTVEAHVKVVPYKGIKVRVVTSRDITERKQAEDRLRMAKEAAETANQAKSTFLANMSHDLRTPLNAVLGFSEILFHREQDPQNKNYLQSIQSSGKALLSLINDVLDLSKIEAGKLELQYTAVSMQMMFSEMSTIFQHKINHKGLSLEVQVNPNLPQSLLLDETRLRQVLMNLIGNAIKFTDEGFIRISCQGVEIKEEIKNRINLIIEVADSGKGIPTEDQENIFNPFEQVSGQKTTQNRGTGLGLAIAKNIINMMSGTITVKSELGQGSTFRVELKNVEITDKTGVGIKNSWDFDPDSIRFSPAKVLIVDDIEYNRDVLAGYLNLFNLTLYFAESGGKAVEQAQKHSPDLILMDMKMPEMDGFEASKILKNGDSTGDIPIVAVTASALAQDEEIIRQYCDDYLRKPISQHDLVKTLKKVLTFTEEKKTISRLEAGIDMVVPAEIELKELYEVALDGNMDGITSYLDKLEGKDEKLTKFCAQLRTLALSYKVEKIITLLKKLI